MQRIVNKMVATSTPLNNGGDEIVEDKCEQWTDDSCSERTLVDQSREGDDDDDDYKNGCEDYADSEREQSTEDAGSERIDSEDENENEEWEHSTEESVSERSDDGQSCGEDVDEEKKEKLCEEPSGDWDNSCSRLPGDDDYVETAKNTENEEDRVKSPAEIKYDELPFRKQHYFLTYALQILEAVCFRFGQRFREYLEDPVWKRFHLVVNPSSDDPDYRRVYGDWLVEDGVEVMWWIWFFGYRAPDMPITDRTAHILNSVYFLRNAALHRGDEGGLDFKKWELAMQVPELLVDDVGKKEMADLSEYVLGDGTMDEDVRAAVELKMYTPRLSATKYQLLERIQTLLEESCFDLAVRKIPDVLTMNGWDCVEKVELQRWIPIFENTEVVNGSDDLATDFFTRYDTVTLTDILINLLHNARMNIRNAAAHRLPVSDEHLVNRVHTAIRMALLQSDWPRAFEIEIVSEMWFTSTSRKEVLDRLARSYRNGRIETRYELRRRLELAVFLAKEQGKEVDEQDGEQLVVNATCNVEEEMVGRTRHENTWSPSMHECLKTVEVVEEVIYIKEVEEEDGEKLVANTCGVGEVMEDGSWGTLAEED